MPNFEGIQFELIRKELDPKYLALVEELEKCYYGDKDENGRFSRVNCWKDNTSRPFTLGGELFDVQATPEESEALFNKLHGAIWKQYEIEFHQLNQTKPLVPDILAPEEKEMAEKKGFYIENGEKKICRIAEKAYNEVIDQDGNVKSRKVEEAQSWLAKEGINIQIPEISIEKKNEILRVKGK